MYIAIIGDIKRSRASEARAELQQLLKGVLADCNEYYAEQIAAKFTLTLGDEFQGLLTDILPALAIITQIKWAIYPEQLRVAIGIGDITTAIDPDQAIGADGPAYYLARQGIDALKIAEKSYETAQRDCVIVHQHDDANQLLAAVNGGLALLYQIEQGWTDKQRAVVELLIEQPDIKQQQLARELGIVQSSVVRRIQASHYYSYIAAQQAQQQSLCKLWELYQ